MKSKMKELEVEQMERTNSSPLCYCGVPAALRTSWTKDNPGRSILQGLGMEMKNGWVGLAGLSVLVIF
ncbi:hypothetical protein GQ457_15G024520 [Hibiscus cannabinus]